MSSDSHWILLFIISSWCFLWLSPWWSFFFFRWLRSLPNIFFPRLVWLRRNADEYGFKVGAWIHWAMDTKRLIQYFMKIHRNIFHHKSFRLLERTRLCSALEKRSDFVRLRFVCEESPLNAPTLILLMDRFGWIKRLFAFYFCPPSCPLAGNGSGAWRGICAANDTHTHICRRAFVLCLFVFGGR